MDFIYKETTSAITILRPATTIFFGITLLPFGENYTSGNILPSVGGKSLF